MWLGSSSQVAKNKKVPPGRTSVLTLALAGNNVQGRAQKRGITGDLSVILSLRGAPGFGAEDGFVFDGLLSMNLCICVLHPFKLQACTSCGGEYPRLVWRCVNCPS